MSELADRKIGLHGGLHIPQVGFGTFEISEDDAERCVAEAIEVGYRHIDCAEAYWNQKEVGKGLKGIDRDKLWLTSKLWRGEYTKEKVPEACDRMLRHLDIDYLDLWLIHWPDASVPIGETLEAMHKCVDQGKVRCLGVCNATTHHLKDIFDVGVPIVNLQIEIHPYLYQTELIDFAWKNKLAVTGYSPIARGEILKDETVKAVASAHNKTAAQVSLRWLLQKGIIVIPKSVHKKRMEENAAIFDFELSDADMATLDGLHKGYRTINPDFNEFDY